MLDVIIVGGGVAGCYLASRINPKYNVLLIERNKKIIPKDSGIVSTNFDKLFGKGKKYFIKHKITRMDCISPSGLTFSLSDSRPYAYILKRKKFALFLRNQAKKRAEIIYDNVNGIKYSRGYVSIKTNDAEYKAKMIIGCDGANSVVRKSLGVEDPNMALGIMVKTKTKLEGEINVFFNKYFSPDFFSWIIPQNYEYGLMTSVRPADYFRYFVKNMYLPHGKTYSYMIPYSYTKSYGNRALLVGDACGQNKPLTGGGIIFSMFAARHAARIISDALEEERFDGNFLSYYEKYWKKEFAWGIEKQFMLRMLYRKLVNKEIDDIFVNFGPILAMLNGFDYDRLEGMWKSIPKIKLAKFILSKMSRIF